MGYLMMTSLQLGFFVSQIASTVYSPDNTLGTGSDGTELLVPPEHREGGVAHLHAVELPLPLSHGSSHRVPLYKSDLRDKEQVNVRR